MKILSIVGARPQFVKLSVIAHAASACGAQHVIVHTGQHYDDAMSEVFFRELRIARPDHNLGVGSGLHGAQTGEMIKRLEPVLLDEAPDWVLLYGDTNSTLAGAVTASKLHFKVAHIEAGLRSFNRRMPEEINRVAADHISDLLLCPTSKAVENLEREGLREKSVLTGDVMFDAAITALDRGEAEAPAVGRKWPEKAYALATIHRAENTDDPARLLALLRALDAIGESICPVVLPLHPRTATALPPGWQPRHVDVIPPVSYLNMLLFEKRARMILTDSGGVQKEAYFFQVPCITLRDETEWEETLANRCNTIVGANPDRIVEAARGSGTAGPWTAVYGDGHAGEATLRALY